MMGNDFPAIDYREPFICPYHNCVTDKGWCWECAVETYGYDKAKLVHEGKMTIDEAKRGGDTDGESRE